MAQKVYILLLSLCIATLCYGQEGKIFTADKELSSSMINNIYQDNESVIWIATEDGLNCYDGAKFTVYKNDPKDEHSLKNNYTRILFEDSKGNFFVGTLTGLQLYDRARQTFNTIPMNFSTGDHEVDANVSSIIERKNGDVIIGTSGHGLFFINHSSQEMQARQQLDIVPSYLITQIYEDRNERLWVITNDKGIFQIDP